MKLLEIGGVGIAVLLFGLPAPAAAQNYWVDGNGVVRFARAPERRVARPAPARRRTTLLERFRAIEPHIREAARRYRLHPALIRAVAYRESNGEPYAVSSAGAGGIMQLMPGTARGLGVRDRWDSRENILGGTRYLRMMLDRFGNLRLALAAYNAGPGRVARCRCVPRDKKNETINYVAFITRNWRRFMTPAERAADRRQARNP